MGDVVTEPEEDPILSPWSAALVLIATTVIISYAADYMVASIDDIAASGAISKTFIGLILIPIVGNAAEHVTACVVAVKNKMDLAMGVAIGSSIQIALLVTPSLVLLGWAIGQPMTLHFETFETIAFALSVMVVTYTVQDGKSNYLEGAMVSFSPLSRKVLLRVVETVANACDNSLWDSTSLSPLPFGPARLMLLTSFRPPSSKRESLHVSPHWTFERFPSKFVLLPTFISLYICYITTTLYFLATNTFTSRGFPQRKDFKSGKEREAEKGREKKRNTHALENWKKVARDLLRSRSGEKGG